MPPAAAPTTLTAPFSVPSFIRFGWETFKKRPWFFAGAALLFGIASWVASFLNSVLVGLIGESVNEGLAMLIGFPTGVAINVIINIGWIAFFLKAHDDIAAASASDFWHPQKFWNFLGVSLLYASIVTLGYILLIVPGVIASVMFFFAPWLVVDKGLGPIEALKASARITKGNRWRILALMGATVLVSFLGALALIVGLLVAIPVVALATAAAYRRLSVAADAGSAPQRLSGGEVGFLVAGLLIPLIAVIGILASVVLASLNVAREKGMAAQSAADLKLLQLSVELYALQHGSYPETLDEAAADPQMGDSLSTIRLEEYSYAAENDSYILCSNTSTPEGGECVTPEDLDTSGAAP